MAQNIQSDDIIAGVEILPNVVITNPRILERLIGTRQPVDYVEPYRLCFVTFSSCDYCGPMPHGKEAEMVCLPGDYFMGVIACDKCDDKAKRDIENYCKANLRYLITNEKIKELGLGGDLKIKRSSGEVENGWRVSINERSFVITFGKDGRIIIPMIKRSSSELEAITKGVGLNDICDLNGLNFQELSTKIQEL